MRFASGLTMLAVLATTVVYLSGCSGSKPEAPPAGAAAEDHADEHGHEHEHSHEGPHGGHVVELGTDAYHAELTHDDATHAVGIYVLDGAAAANAPVAVESVTINAVAGGPPMQFTLPAKALADDPAGKASYFELVDESLCDGLDGGWDPTTATARLNITIDGTPYVGEIELHEEGEGQDHAHE